MKIEIDIEKLIYKYKEKVAELEHECIIKDVQIDELSKMLLKSESFKDEDDKE